MSPIDWPAAIEYAEDLGERMNRTALLQGAPPAIAGALAVAAVMTSFHVPGGAPGGGLACRLCGREVPYPCPPLRIASRFDPALAAVIEATLARADGQRPG